MTVRDKAGLVTQIGTLLPDNNTRDISEADVRSVLGDVVDSMAFAAGMVTRTQVMALIAVALADAVTGNTETNIAVDYIANTGKLNFVATGGGGGGGLTTAQVNTLIAVALTSAVEGNTEDGITVGYSAGKLNFSVPATGITLAQAIAAVQIDATAVNGVELERVASASAVTIGLTSPAVTHLNYAGLSADAAAAASEFTVSGMDHALMVPTIPTGTTRYIIYAKPESEGPFTFAYWYVPGSPNAVNVYGTSFVDGAGTITLGGEAHTWIRSRVPLPPLSGGRVLDAG